MSRGKYNAPQRLEKVKIVRKVFPDSARKKDENTTASLGILA